jgi:hypothetical protein
MKPSPTSPFGKQKTILYKHVMIIVSVIIGAFGPALLFMLYISSYEMFYKRLYYVKTNSDIQTDEFKSYDCNGLADSYGCKESFGFKVHAHFIVNNTNYVYRRIIQFVEDENDIKLIRNKYQTNSTMVFYYDPYKLKSNGFSKGAFNLDTVVAEALSSLFILFMLTIVLVAYLCLFKFAFKNCYKSYVDVLRYNMQLADPGRYV